MSERQTKASSTCTSRPRFGQSTCACEDLISQQQCEITESNLVITLSAVKSSTMSNHLHETCYDGLPRLAVRHRRPTDTCRDGGFPHLIHPASNTPAPHSTFALSCDE